MTTRVTIGVLQHNNPPVVPLLKSSADDTQIRHSVLSVKRFLPCNLHLSYIFGFAFAKQHTCNG